MTSRTYSNSSKVLYFCANYIDPTVITCIKLQHSRLVEFRSVKENSLIELLALVDDESLSKELRETINNIKIKDITVQPATVRKNFDVDNTPEKDVYTQLVQVLRNLHDSVLNDRLF